MDQDMRELSVEEMSAVSGGGNVEGGTCPNCGSHDLDAYIYQWSDENNQLHMTLRYRCNGCKMDPIK